MKKALKKWITELLMALGGLAIFITFLSSFILFPILFIAHLFGSSKLGLASEYSITHNQKMRNTRVFDENSPGGRVFIIPSQNPCPNATKHTHSATWQKRLEF